MERRKRYNKQFMAWIESKCQESGEVKSVDDEYYESFVALTNKELAVIVRVILHGTAREFNKKLSSGAWKSDDEMYEFVMPYLELIAEGKLAFDEETGEILFRKPQGDPPTEDMWNRIQKRITSSRSAIRVAIVRSAKSRERAEHERGQEGQ